MSGAANWLRFAAEDLQMAHLALNESVYNQVCFHAQQCAEKTLKAWLVHHNQPTPRVHQTSLLLQLCPRPLPFSSSLEDEILVLDRFYIPTRYPDAIPGSLPLGLPGEADAREALDTAQRLYNSIKTAL